MSVTAMWWSRGALTCASHTHRSYITKVLAGRDILFAQWCFNNVAITAGTYEGERVLVSAQTQ